MGRFGLDSLVGLWVHKRGEREKDYVPLEGDDLGSLYSSITTMPVNEVVQGDINTPDITAAPHTVPTQYSSVTITPPGGSGSVGLHITGTWTGQLEFEGSMDAVNFPAVGASNGLYTVNAIANAGTPMNSIFLLPGAAYQRIRVRASALSAGTAVITLVASVCTTASIPTGAIPAGTNDIGNVGRTATVVTPIAQVTTDNYADVVGSTLDTLHHLCASYTIIENNVNAIKWQVLASNDAAFAVSVVAQVEAIVAKAGSSSFSTATAVWRYYKVQVKASVGAAQGNVTVVGIAKG